MKDSVKANLIVFFIIAIIAFCISTSFASLTVNEDNESYKLISIENNSFEPNHIEKVPYVAPKPVNKTNITNMTNNTTHFNKTPSYNITNHSERIR